MSDLPLLPLLRVDNLYREEESRTVVNSVSFTQSAGERIAIAGATGSGKSTLLRMIAGLVQPTSGSIFLNGIRVKGPDEKLLPGHPSIAYLSQHFELRSHYRVGEILAMASKVSENRAKDLYELCRIEGFLQRWTHQLSGGERQRVGLAQRLVTAPELLLLDEPWSNLDLWHKQILKDVTVKVSNEAHVTCLLVSHDPTDLLPWADRLLLLKDGTIVQDAEPKIVYYKPADQYVAGLFGPYNLLKPVLQKAFGLAISKDDVFIRPDQLRLSKKRGAIQATITHTAFMGSYAAISLKAFDEHFIAHTLDKNWQMGERVYVSVVD